MLRLELMARKRYFQKTWLQFKLFTSQFENQVNLVILCVETSLYLTTFPVRATYVYEGCKCSIMTKDNVVSGLSRLSDHGGLN